MSSIDAKIVIVGSASVGKSSIAKRFVRNEYSGDRVATIGAALLTKTLNLQGNIINMQIWDTAGQEQYRSLTPLYYRNAMGAIAVFDASKPETITDLRYWLRQLAINQIPLVSIVGNKCDLIDTDQQLDIVQSAKDCLRLEDDQKIYFTSALTGEGVEQIFLTLAQLICKKEGVTLRESQKNLQIVDLQNTQQSDKTRCCFL
ncbi:hypothetical protein MP228_005342 [Amoeboaphelidium protococcarum]|nr:hypothetical protein MP228_005342 [Amoeboaphelidium protococcarum]